MRTGLVIGKFYPPHAGHYSVIKRAVKECDSVLVVVLWSERESIGPHLRKRWIEQHFWNSDVVVRTQNDEVAVDYDDPDIWQKHIYIILSAFPNNFTGINCPSRVYGSEPYIDELARRMVMTPVKVDLDRRAYPVSGTAIRKDPEANWDYLDDNVKAWFTKRIAVVGAESTGTTTLARSLAWFHDTSWVPEYGRHFSQGVGLGHDWIIKDLQHIGQLQQEAEDYMAGRVRKPLLFLDTDAQLATKLWDEFLTGNKYYVPPVRDKPVDAYILTLPKNIPWENDGTREGEDFRLAMHQRFLEELVNGDIPFTVVVGGQEQRLAQAVRFTKEIMDEGWNLNDPLG